MIRKFAGQKSWGLYSVSTPGKRLGVFPSRKAALKRERQIQFWKRVKK